MLYIKLVWMYVIAMFTAIFIYPLLHELGHFFAALLVGAEVVEMSIFPMPYVSMFVDPYDSLGQAVIGMCGMIFPMICILFRPKRFVSSIVVITTVFVSALAWLLSCVAIVANRLGFCWKNEDAITVIRSMERAESLVFFFCLASFIISLHVLLKRKYVCRIIAFF